MSVLDSSINLIPVFILKRKHVYMYYCAEGTVAGDVE